MTAKRTSGDSVTLSTLAAVQRFTTEEIFAAKDRCVVRWRYDWTGKEGSPGHIRGVDLFRVRDGKVAGKFAYVKG